MLDGGKVIFSQQTDKNELDIGGFESVKNLTVAVSATADNYMDSGVSSLALANPVGVECVGGGNAAEAYSVFTTSGVKVAENATTKEMRNILPKGVYVLKGRGGAGKIFIR